MLGMFGRHRISIRITNRLAMLVLLLLMSAGHAHAQGEDRNKPDQRRGYLSPQFARTDAGSVVLLWVRPVENGHDLLIARRVADGALEAPQRLNREPGSVRHLTLDEARPVLATGSRDEVGVVWFDVRGHVRANVSTDGGRSFGGPHRLDAGPGRPEHAFAGADFAPDGSLHVAWLDARNAPVDLEEPALLYTSRVTRDGAGPERDLTSAHTATVCGCCRPSVRADRSGIEILFRNVEEEGWRDIHRITGTLSGDFGAPERVGPRTWKIDGCPMAGATSDGSIVVWKDGSVGRPRVVSGTTTAALGLVIDAGRTGWIPSSPRWVGSDDGASSMMLIPGAPDGRLLALRGGRWEVVVANMPSWCHSALVLENQLLMVGDEYGRLRLEALDVTW